MLDESKDGEVSERLKGSDAGSDSDSDGSGSQSSDDGIGSQSENDGDDTHTNRLFTRQRDESPNSKKVQVKQRKRFI